MKINVGTLNAFIEAPLPLQHVVARADGVASGPSMGKTFPDGTPYYVRPITGPLLEGMIVVVIAKRRWMGSKGRFFNSIIKRVNKIKVGSGCILILIVIFQE
mgnify:FL=1